jgi:hypothetical protein
MVTGEPSTGATTATGAGAGAGRSDSPATEAVRRQLQDSLFPTLLAAVGVGFVMAAGTGRSELGKILLRAAGDGVAGPTLRMVAAALSKVDPDKARAALEVESRLKEPLDYKAAVHELRLGHGSGGKDRQGSQGHMRRGPVSRRS